jgi:hypothetical protein
MGNRYRIKSVNRNSFGNLIRIAACAWEISREKIGKSPGQAWE